jgi:AbrB family looped-hinge helix DNA binding protein
MAKVLSADQKRKMDGVAHDAPTKSAAIRALWRAGFERADIARYLDIRYQHVRNVIVQAESADVGAVHVLRETGQSDFVGQTKADRIRALHAQGMSRGEIARELGISYQHVYNTLKRASAGPETVTVGPDGRIVIPVQFRRALQIEPGDKVRLQMEDGELRVIGRMAAIEQAQALVRKFVPEGVSLSDELIADRRAEAAKEDGAG